MQIGERTDGDLKELKRRVRQERDAEQRDRLRAAFLAILGKETSQIQEMLGRSRGFVQRWASAYRDHGIQALARTPHPGKAPRVHGELAHRLKARLDAGPREEDRVCTLRGVDVQRILAEELNVRCSLQATYDTLHRLGYSCLSPRPRHQKQDEVLFVRPTNPGTVARVTLRKNFCCRRFEFDLFPKNAEALQNVRLPWWIPELLWVDRSHPGAKEYDSLQMVAGDNTWDAAGWPLPALRTASAHWRTWGATPSQKFANPQMQDRGYTTVQAFGRDFRLFTEPVWLGILADTLVYAIVVRLIIAAWIWLRRFRRRRAGLCAYCGYDRRGQPTSACAECGAVGPLKIDNKTLPESDDVGKML